MKEKVKSLLNSKIKDLNMYVSNAYYSEQEGKKIFNIELDSDEVIDLEKITEVSKIINDIIDNTNEITDDYDELDIFSKEKGVVEDE